MAHAAATYAAGLVMIDQPLKHSLVSHTAHVTFACANEGEQLPQAIADDFQAAFSGAFAPSLDTECTIEKPTILLGDGTAFPAAAVGSFAASAGGNALNGNPPQVAALLKKITALAGRKNRGRTYLPFCMDDGSVNQAGLLVGDIVGNLQAACNAFLTSLNTDGLPLIICNRAMGVDGGKPYVIEYQVGAPVTQMVLQAYVATQRRRLARS